MTTRGGRKLPSKYKIAIGELLIYFIIGDTLYIRRLLLAILLLRESPYSLRFYQSNALNYTRFYSYLESASLYIYSAITYPRQLGFQEWSQYQLNLLENYTRAYRWPRYGGPGYTSFLEDFRVLEQLSTIYSALYNITYSFYLSTFGPLYLNLFFILNPLFGAPLATGVVVLVVSIGKQQEQVNYRPEYSSNQQSGQQRRQQHNKLEISTYIELLATYRATCRILLRD